MTRSTPQAAFESVECGETRDHWLAEEVIDAASTLVERGAKRSILGIVGAPGAGKSTLSAALMRSLEWRAVNVPMDGYHLADCQLARLGLADRKGAPQTFDGHGYRALLARLRDAYGSSETVYAPSFERTLDQPIAAGIAVGPDTPLVITEGNYLLLDEAPWPEVAELVDEIWYLNVPDEVREDWLVARHIRCGRTKTQAWNWIAGNDRLNADRVTQTKKQAERHLVWDGTTLRFR